ncbi:hypothetical protein GGF46_004483 [Coemansia sp. RSA 552]|nr:hypothetical protein GGF46_004483 [Coemansia sp. RSA 552]
MSRFDAPEFKLGAALYADKAWLVTIFKDKIILNRSIMEDFLDAEPIDAWIYQIDILRHPVYGLNPDLEEYGLNRPDDRALLGGITGLSTGRLQHNAAAEAKTRESCNKPFRNK